MRIHIAVGLSALMLLPLVGQAEAQSSDPRFMNCGQLWYARNSFYKEAGYCFNTQRGIRAFGNAGCQYDNVNDVPLTRYQANEVAELQRWERIKSCPR